MAAGETPFRLQCWQGQQLDGSISSVNWIGPPHFFLLDNVIALYIGDDETVISALLGISGESFAGSPIELVQNGPTQAPTPDTGALAPFPVPTQPAPIESVELT